MSKSLSVAPEGRPTHGVRIRVHGVDEGSAAHQRVLDGLHGQISQFLGKNQQQVAISGQEQYSAKKAIPGGHLHYHNNQGQETLTIHVETSREGGKEEVTKQAPWEWALVEFTIADVGVGRVRIAAFLNVPLPVAIRDLTPTEFIPVKGVSYARQGLDGENPLVSFGGNFDNQVEIAETSTSDWIGSLRVDLRPFPNQTVEVKVYAQVEPYSVTGGDGSPNGTVISSTLYGYLGHDYPGVSLPMTPTGAANAPVGDVHVNTSFFGFGEARLISSFPELAGRTFVYSNATDNQAWGAGFQWNRFDHPGIYWGDPALVSPNTDPNAFCIWPAYGSALEEWAPGFDKKRTEFGQTIDYGSGGVPDAGPVITPHPLGGSTHFVTITGINYVSYFVPTWRFESPAPVTISAVCSRRGNPWNCFSTRTANGTNLSYVWENQTSYPHRPPLKQLAGSFTMPSEDAPSFPESDYPFYRFGLALMGTLKIDTKSGSVKFEAA